MRSPPAWATAAGVVILAMAAVRDQFPAHAEPTHTVLAVLLVGVVLVASWLLLPRPRFALAAGLTAALWEPIHKAPIPVLLAALAVGLLSVAPPRRIPAWGEALIAGFAGTGAASLVATTPVPLAAAFVAAAIPAWIRPHDPTAGSLSLIRWLGVLLLPAGLFVALLLNAATRWADRLSTVDVLAKAVGLLGLLALLGLALCGVATLLSSDERRQQTWWLSAAVAAGPVAAAVAMQEPDVVFLALTPAAVPMAALAVLATAEWAARFQRHGLLFTVLAPLLSAAQVRLV